ncbi:MAG: hypothetical protein K8R59_02275 [Thermoanaerobaculales bacterium]|nr:hypothetical protein [Thermoanaerobaculales bacterium]
MNYRLLEKWLVILVALHSLGVAVVLVGMPRWAAVFGGWGEVDTVFFIRQGGVFHLVVAVGYLMEYFRHGTVRLLLTAKCVAVVFLLLSWLGDSHGAWALPLATLSDGFMALVVFLAHRAVDRPS